MKRIIGIIIGCMLCWEGEAQFRSFAGPASANQQLIEEAVQKGLFIVRQSYQLEDTAAETPAYYGREGKPYFGQLYSLAARLKGGYVIDGRLLTPWAEDVHFDEYRNSTQYRPVISQTAYRNIGEKTYQPLGFRVENRDTLEKGSVLLVKDSLFSEGFSLWEEEGICKGWIVLAVGEKPLSESDSVSLSLMIYRTEINREADKSLYEIKAPSTALSVVGGVYIYPVVTAIGQLNFRLVGLVQKIGDKWYILTVKEASSMESVPSGLTPVGVRGETVAREETVVVPEEQEEQQAEEQPQEHKKGKRDRKKRS